jgi:lipopolysaccharide/colanic/teichoic acid biosynthesis glycosyltransferase
VTRVHRRVTASDPAAPAAPRGARVWGLDPAGLHDTYWRSVGVAVVRRGRGETELPRADGYLLLDPDQLAAFSLVPAANEIAWSRARLHRVAIVSPREALYHERVVIGLDGLVKRIKRCYGADSTGHRVFLARDRRIARAWAAAGSRREGRRAIQSLESAFRTGFLRVQGESYRLGDVADERRFLDNLVELWPDPSETLVGIEHRGDGVFVPAGLETAGRTVIGPVWIGAEGIGDADRPVVGPACLTDRVEAAPAVPLPMEEIRSAPSRSARVRLGTIGAYAFVKRSVDLAVSALTLLALSPIMLLAAIAVVVDDGFPVFFGHRRQGRDGRIFRCWKFRTMRRNAESLARELRGLNVCDGPQFFIKDDPRVTRVGRRLRAWNVDELPQLWNVLVGDMSLVGPRPSPEGENQYCPSWRESRLSVRPGITGLWQVRRTRRPGYDFQEWIRYDIEYVRTAGPWLDFRICMETALSIIRGSGRHGPNGTR